MKRCSRFIAAAILLAGTFAFTVSAAQIKPGRDIPEMRSFSFELSAGSLQSIEGSVRETKRAYTDGKGPESFSRFLENYDLAELGFDDSYSSIGFALQKKWTFLTLGLALNYSQLDASGTAEREPFAIGADVSYRGQSYDYMLIEQGTKYDASIDLLVLNLDLDITPFHIESDERHITFSPWLHLGLQGVVADYTIDAGPARGVTKYEFHPYDYVRNGKGSNVNGGAIPEFGLGGELRLGVFETPYRMATLSLEAQYFFLNMDTSLGAFNVSARNDKDITIDYKGYSASATMEIPVSESVDFLVGLRYRHIEGDADVEAKRRSKEEQVALQEKYDKRIHLEFDTIYATVGLAF